MLLFLLLFFQVVGHKDNSLQVFFKAGNKVAQSQYIRCPNVILACICSQIQNAQSQNSSQTLHARRQLKYKIVRQRIPKKKKYIDRLHIKINTLSHSSSVPFEVREHQPLLNARCHSLYLSFKVCYTALKDPSRCRFLLSFSRNEFHNSCYFKY